VAVYLHNGIVVRNHGWDKAIDNVSRPSYSGISSLGALLIWHGMDFTDRKDMTGRAAPPSAQQNRYRFLTVTWEEMISQCLVLDLG